ncbi:preprotein translocase subunit SecY [Desulfuromonas acetoxidans]|uniref:Protein translocase subunit SecY n=1 Tax=Desulfuromonas acetoxidans (strain DSM 684 / 11070) TaxID=281689 RepID=Q1JXZ1_DESA6|nr:preprotein translocase subunit SecY [Desulfuromonas acetoxidans]EAT15205.1 SecY protein [Desulfuromonas acetoxidans DSM 684]MBF0644033.1 preprotein translocase subunit SecY [Desulfuromonas acetoxidans]NVD23271.1 preprotein translocase subunit SecY [Desulfuromonas acetoxidans]NVE15488.1 preprotein translocase subunit SecY [Desulfuromonas acetoxidans]
MLKSLQNIFRIAELRQRILFTLMMLAVYRVGCHVPTPGVNGQVLASFFEGTQGTLLGMVSAFTGGALQRMTVFALGIMPYISASIILQLLTVVFEPVQRLSKEGEQGRKVITRWTRYGTVLLSVVQGAGIAVGLQSMNVAGDPVVPNQGIGFVILTVFTLTAGTAFIMWIGEQITERGIGNGISLIIFAGIIANMPSAIVNTIRLLRTGAMPPVTMIFILVLMVLVIMAIVFMERAQRRVPIHYAKRVVGMRNLGGQSSHLPLKINMSGVIPPIFASSIIMFPATVANFVHVEWVQKLAGMMTPSHWLYNVFFVAFIVFFCYFYTAVTFNPVDVAENVKNQGGYIPGVRPGKATSDYLDVVLSRLTFAGAIYVSVVCVLPTMLIGQLNVPFYFGGTSLLIVVGVGMDTASQIESHLISRSYEGFMRGASIKGRRG